MPSREERNLLGRPPVIPRGQRGLRKASKKPPPATTTSGFGTTQRSEGGRSSTRTSPTWRRGPPSTCTSLRRGAAFVHPATAENTAEDETYLNDPFTNAIPDVVPSVTQNWNPGGE